MFENRAVRLEMGRHATENEEMVLFMHATKHFFVLYTICKVHLLKSDGCVVFVAIPNRVKRVCVCVCV